ELETPVGRRERGVLVGAREPSFPCDERRRPDADEERREHDPLRARPAERTRCERRGREGRAEGSGARERQTDGRRGERDEHAADGASAARDRRGREQRGGHERIAREHEAVGEASGRPDERPGLDHRRVLVRDEQVADGDLRDGEQGLRGRCRRCNKGARRRRGSVAPARAAGRSRARARGIGSGAIALPKGTFRPAALLTSPVMKKWTLARIARGIRKHALEGLVDALLVAVCYILVTGVRLGGRIDAPEHTALAAVALGAGAAQVLMNIVLDVYWRDWSVAALEDLVAIVKASAVVALGLFVFDLVGPDHPIPFSAILPGFGLVVLAEGTLKIRPRWRQIAGAAFGARGKEGAIIVGAGRTGALLARDLSDGSRGTRVICFVDDDPRKQGTYVRGARVSGTVDDLRSLIETHTPAVVVIAVSDAPSPLVRRVLAATRNTSVRVRAVGGFRLGPSDRGPLRPIDIDELLQREPVRLDAPETRSFLE